MVGDWVAERDAVIRVPESHAIDKSLGIVVGELQGPVFAGVGGFVDARAITRAGAQQVGEVGAKGFHIAEVERLGAGDLGGLPGVSGVHGSQIGAVGTGGPRESVGEHADATKIGCGIGLLNGWILGGKGSGEDRSSEEMKAHAIIVPEVMGLACRICILSQHFREKKERHGACSAGDLLWID